MKTRGVLMALFFLCVTSVSLLAQIAPSLAETSQTEQQSAGLPDHGFFTYIGIGAGHDPFAKYTGELDISGGYDFGRTLEFETGMPFFFLSTTDHLDASGASHYSNRYSSFGDAFVRAKITPAIPGLDYTGTATVTAPTGSKNVSTGQATWDCNNHVEIDWWHLRPLGEFVLGNVPPVTLRLVEPFTISGYAAQLRMGNSFSITKGLTFDASFYESIPIGNSDVSVVAIPAASPASRSNLLSDRGFTGSLSRSDSGRLEFDITYNRSLAHSLDVVNITVRYRIGHVRKVYE
jgi:hypothetical protein